MYVYVCVTYSLVLPDHTVCHYHHCHRRADQRAHPAHRAGPPRERHPELPAVRGDLRLLACRGDAADQHRGLRAVHDLHAGVPLPRAGADERGPGEGSVAGL